MAVIPLQQALVIAGDHHRLGRLPEALACFQKSLGLDANSPLTLMNFGQLLEQQGQTDAALGHLQRAAALAGANSGPHNVPGNLLARLERHAEARAMLPTCPVAGVQQRAPAVQSRQHLICGPIASRRRLRPIAPPSRPIRSISIPTTIWAMPITSWAGRPMPKPASAKAWNCDPTISIRI